MRKRRTAPGVMDHRAKAALRRGGAVLVAVGLLSSICIFFATIGSLWIAPSAGLLGLDLLAGSDKLTGARNRRRLDEAVHSEMDRLARYRTALST